MEKGKKQRVVKVKSTPKEREIMRKIIEKTKAEAKNPLTRT